jgi:Arc/MetJ-type ribon-helix-helix transcriptional regulator
MPPKRSPNEGLGRPSETAGAAGSLQTASILRGTAPAAHAASQLDILTTASDSGQAFRLGIESENAIERELTKAIRSYQRDALRGQDLAAALSQDFPPDALFCSAILSSPSILRDIRRHLMNNEVDLPEHATRRIPQQVAGIYASHSEKARALLLIEHHRSHESRVDNDQASPNMQSDLKPGTIPKSSAAATRGTKIAPSSQRQAEDQIATCWTPETGEFVIASGNPDGDDSEHESSDEDESSCHHNTPRTRRSHKHRGPLSQRRTEGLGHDTPPRDRQVTGILNRFRDNSSQFSGSPDQVLHEYVQRYKLSCKDYCISSPTDLELFHNVFRADALNYYSTFVEKNVSSLGRAIRLMMERYNSAADQNRVRAMLQNIRVTKLVADGMTISFALEKVRDTIARHAVELPKEMRTDFHKTSLLRSAVLDCTWADPVLSNFDGDFTFQELASALQNQVQLDEERAIARGTLSLRQKVVQNVQFNSQPGTLSHGPYGQGRYGHPPGKSNQTDPAKAS